jgi:hypothetical protein
MVKHNLFIHSQYRVSQQSDLFHTENGYAECISPSGKRSSDVFGINKKLSKASGQAILISSQYVGEGF